MSQFIDDSERRMIPRWRDSRDAAKFKETTPLSALPTQKLEYIEDNGETSLLAAQDAWEANRGLAFANDFVATALLHKSLDVAKDAAKFVLENENRTTRQAVALARKLLGFPRLSESQSLTIHERSAAEVRLLRGSLRRTPDNPVGWVDLARNYMVLGEHLKAERAIQIAISLAPEHRFTVRAATRLFHVLGDAERALHLLRGRAVTPNDPWLIAAETAIARVVERTPKFVRRGREFLKSGRFSPFHLSELAASLGSLDFEDGNDRQARKKFQIALQEPTENTIAQAAWVGRHNLELDVSENYIGGLDSHEAKAWAHLEARDWQSALEQAQNWVRDEPFSSRSVTFGGHIASVALENHNEAINFLKIGLEASPNDFSLLNNIAFYYASAGDPENATKHLGRASRLTLDKIDNIYLVATEGFIAYRTGDAELGRAKYIAALRSAKELDKPQLAFAALCFFAQEEAYIDGYLLKSLLSQLEKLRPMYQDAALEPLLQRLLAARPETSAQRALFPSVVS